MFLNNVSRKNNYSKITTAFKPQSQDPYKNNTSDSEKRLSRRSSNQSDVKLPSIKTKVDKSVEAMSDKQDPPR